MTDIQLFKKAWYKISNKKHKREEKEEKEATEVQNC